MLIDRIIPVFEFAERHATTIPAPPTTVYRSVREVDFARSLIIRVLFGVRGLAPLFRQGRRRRMRAGLNDFLRAGFLLLDEQPGTEVVLGTVWGPAARDIASADLTADRFVALDTPGHVKAVMNFAVRPTATGSLVTTETRVHATDTSTRRRFARYWLLVGPFSALIRRRMLAVLRQHAARIHQS